MTLLLSLFPASLTTPWLLSYANGRAIVWANSLEFLPTKEKWRWKERGEKGTDRQEGETRQKWGWCTSEGQITVPKRGSLQEYKEPRGGFLVWCISSRLVYYILVLLRGATNEQTNWVIFSLFICCIQLIFSLNKVREFFKRPKPKDVQLTIIKNYEKQQLWRMKSWALLRAIAVNMQHLALHITETLSLFIKL